MIGMIPIDGLLKRRGGLIVRVAPTAITAPVHRPAWAAIAIGIRIVIGIGAIRIARTVALRIGGTICRRPIIRRAISTGVVLARLGRHFHLGDNSRLARKHMF